MYQNHRRNRNWYLQVCKKIAVINETSENIAVTLHNEAHVNKTDRYKGAKQLTFMKR